MEDVCASRCYCPFRFCSFVVLCSLMTSINWAQDSNKPQLNIENSRPVLEAIRLSHNLPGLGAAIVTDEGLQLLATTGVRKQGDDTPITDDDRWHLGSCGKAITATMIGRLVEAKKMRYEQTMGETFPKLAAKMSDRMHAIKLIDLLSHTSGLPANFNLQNYVGETKTSRARRNVLSEAIETELLSAPGEQFLYSNWGYTLAGHMAEKTAGKSWEGLVRAEVFRPLKLSSAGFGGTGTLGKIDQPWPHAASGQPMPSNGKEMDNMPVMGPAGTIHMSLEDWGKFVSEHLKGHRGKSSYLTKASFQKLHTAIKADYALGWVTMSRPWAGGTALFHNGDNTMNHAVVWAAPEKQFAVLVVTNQSGAGQAVDEVASEFIRLWQEGPSVDAKREQSPFTAVRWNADQPEVEIDGERYKLVSLDDLPVAKIVAFGQKTFAGKWKKRFEEDLVELLSRMGHPPQDTVKLVVQSLTSNKTRVLDDVRMTAANRRAIKAAAINSASNERSTDKQRDIEIDAKHRGRLVGRYQLAPNFILNVKDRDGQLTVTATNQSALKIDPESPTRWSCRDLDATLEFKLAKTGPAKSLILHQNGIEQKAGRIK